MEIYKAGLACRLSDGFFSIDYGRGINEKYIDNCSNVFTLLCYAKDKDNVLKVDSKGNLKKQSNEPAELVTYLTTEKPEILLKEQEKVKDTDYVEISNNQITLEFSINNAGGADCTNYGLLHVIQCQGESVFWRLAITRS